MECGIFPVSFINIYLSILNQVSTSKSLSVGQNLSGKPRAPQRKSNGNGVKQAPIGRIPGKGSVRQRLHPGMLSSQDRATAHYGAVTGLKVTEDGMYLLSAGWTYVVFHWFFTNFTF